MIYFQNEKVILYHDKAENVLPSITNKVQLLLTDPPYGVNYQSNRGRNFEKIHNDDGSLDLQSIILQCCKLLDSHRHLYIFGFDVGWIGELPIASPMDIIWNKMQLGIGNLALPFSSSHEKILFGVYVPSKAGRARGDGKLAAKLRKGSVLTEMRANAQAVKLHPTQKPLGILREMVESSSVFGETVLDPFAGSGSTLVAALLESRKAIGIEMDEQFCEAAAKRLEKVSAANFTDF